MDAIGGKLGKRQVVHPFIEAGMAGNLDMFGDNVTPKDVLGGVRYVAKEDAFAGSTRQFAKAFSRRFDPCTTTKSVEVVEVFLALMELYK